MTINHFSLSAMQPFNLSSLVFFGLASVGLTAIIVDGKVFQPLRAWLLRHGETNPVCRFVANIVTCYQCCGFWSGLLCGVFAWAVSILPVLQHGFLAHPLLLATVITAAIGIFCYGLIGSLLALSYLIVVEFIHSHTLRQQIILPNNEHEEHGGQEE